MALTKRTKTLAIKKAQKHDKDTGSAQVQISLLTKKIEKLSEHLKKNHKDNHSRRGLLQMVANRRKHLKYLQRKDREAYESIINLIGLKK